MAKAKLKKVSNPFEDMADVLGTGVDALFSGVGAQHSDIYLDQIEVRAQVRESFEDDENTLAELAESIKLRGVLQPILLRPSATGFELIAGERRFRAAKIAGLNQIPAYIRDMSDEEAEDAQFAENIQRKNLTQIEEARKIQRDLNKLGTVEAVLEKHQKSRAWLSKMLALLTLPEQARRLISEQVSADIEVINTVKTIERHDPEAAKALVDELASTRGKVNARDKVASVKNRVKPKAELKKTTNAVAEGLGVADERSSAKPALKVGVSHEPTLALELLYSAIVDRKVSPTAAISELKDEAEESVVEWLRKVYETGVEAKDVGRAVIRGIRAGQFAHDDERAFALCAFLQGADGNAKFNLVDILGGVKG